MFAELHTLTQFEQDSKPWLPVILAGQANLLENLKYRTSMPLAARVVARSHLKGGDLETMTAYLKHHLAIAGVNRMLFDDAAITAIHQGSGGLYRKANHLARGALIAAAKTESAVVNAEHVPVTDFIDRYNQLWLVEKLGFRSPRQAFKEYQLKKAA